MSYISLGKFSKYNIYILIALFFDFMASYVFGLNTANKERPAIMFSFALKIKRHTLLKNFIRIASIFFAGLILYFFERKNLKNKKGHLSIEALEKWKSDNQKKNDKSNLLNVILVGILFPLFIIIKGFVDSAGAYVGFWAFEIMYICVISHFVMKIKILKHRRLAIYIMLGLSVVTFIEFFFPSTKHKKTENMNEIVDRNVFDIIKDKYGTYAIPLLFLANEVIHVQRDYCWVKGKYLMDTKSFSPSKLFMIIGSFGFILIIISFSIFTYVPCKTFNNIEKIGDLYINLDINKALELNKEYCSLKDYDENTKTLYLIYDSIKLISQEYSNTDKENLLEIFLAIPLYFIFNVMIEISCLMMVRYLDPNNILIYKNLYFLIKRIIAIILNEADEQYLTHLNFFILQLEEIISIISHMIYIEVLELKFCKLDYELKKNIILRGLEDVDAININERQSLEMDNKSSNSGGSGGSNGSGNEEELLNGVLN